MSRLTGAHAAVYVASFRVMDAFDISIDVPNELIRHRAYEDTRIQVDFDIGGEIKIEASKYCKTTNSNLGQVISLSRAQAEAATPTVLRVIVYQKYGDLTSRIYEGDCWVEGANFSAAAGKMIEEKVTFTDDGNPTYLREL